MTDVPVPDEDVFDSVEELVTYMERTSQLLGDPSVSTMRAVLNPEKIDQRSPACLYLFNLYGYAVDAVICNRVFP